MDFNLLFRIFIAQFGVVLCIGIIVQFIAPGGIDLIFWTGFTLLFTALAYRRQKKTADQLGLSQGHEAYQKTTFTSVLQSNLSIEALSQAIAECEDSVGQVILNNQEVNKQRWKGVANMSKSQITAIESVNGGYQYKVMTQPYWKYTLVDGYSNYKVHQVLKNLIGGIESF